MLKTRAYGKVPRRLIRMPLTSTDLVVIAHRNAFHIDVFAALSGHRCGGDHAEHGHHDGDSSGGKDGNCDGQFPFQEAEYSAIGDKPGPKAGGFSHAKAGND